MSTSFEPARAPMPATYRASAAIICATCGSNAGDDHTFTTTGDVQCRACAERALHALASEASSAGADDLAGERRCRCGGVAAAGKMVDHTEARPQVGYGLIGGAQRIEMGSETVFTCASCGESFALLNRLRKVRLTVRALQIAAAGVALGFIPYAISPGPLSGVAGALIALVVIWLGSRSLLNDVLLRRAHAPVG